MAKPDMGKLRTSLNAAVDKYVKQQARNTIAQNAERDPSCEGYVRIPGPDACDFCIAMGAHDHFYRTRETAGGGAGHGSKDDRYHAYCNCQICLVFRRNGELVCRDPEMGGVMPYDGAAAVRRYQEAGRPTFAKNRAREAARRRADRAAGVRLSAGGKQARKAGANTGRKLAQAEYDAAVKSLSDVASVEELRDAAERIVANWPKDSEGLRHKGQWSELSKLAKAREKELKAGVGRHPREGDDFSAFSTWRPQKGVVNAMRTLANEHYGELVDDKLLGMKKGKPMSFEDADGGRVNPDIAMGGGYRANCQSAVVAYIARRKGWNVQAVPAMPGSVCEQLAHDVSIVWRRSDGSYVSRLDYVNVGRNANILDTYRNLEESVERGRIYTIDFDWKGSGGHTCILERDGEGVIFAYDAQTSSVLRGDDVLSLISKIDLEQDVLMLDVSDLELDRWVAENVLRIAE